MIPFITLSKFRTDVLSRVRGTPDNTGTTDLDNLIVQAVRDVLGQADTRSTKRRIQLAPSGSNDTQYDESDGFYDVPSLITTGGDQDNQYEYHLPVDLKGEKIVDVRHRENYTGEIRLTSEDEFHRRKTVEKNLIAISDNSLERKLLHSSAPQVDAVQISSMDSTTGWTAVGTAASIVAETADFVEGAGAVSFTSGTSGTTSGLTNTALTAVDLTAYEDNGDIFVWVYIPSSASLTSFTLRWGNDSSNYIERTVTNTHDSLAFYDGWNLLRFPWDAEVTETGTVSRSAVDYISFFMTKDSGKASVAGWIVDNIVARINSLTDVVYYSRYGWQTSDGVYKEEATDGADLLNADSDEYQMFLARAREYVSGKMGNDKDEEKFSGQADRKIFEYLAASPSQAIVSQNSYYFMNESNVVKND